MINKEHVRNEDETVYKFTGSVMDSSLVPVYGTKSKYAQNPTLVPYNAYKICTFVWNEGRTKIVDSTFEMCIDPREGITGAPVVHR